MSLQIFLCICYLILCSILVLYSIPSLILGDFHVYDVVRKTHEEPRPDLCVLLTKYVEGYGDLGDAITVPSSDARDYLIPAQLAIYDTPDNRERVRGSFLRLESSYIWCYSKC